MLLIFVITLCIPILVGAREEIERISSARDMDKTNDDKLVLIMVSRDSVPTIAELSVQSFFKISTIPSRSLPISQSSDKHMASQALPKIPILDLSDVDALTPGTASWLSACREVCHALEEYGGFVAAYSSLSLELHNQILEASKELFYLPTETKMQYPYPTEYLGQRPQFPLYERLGIVNATSWEEIQNFTNLMWPNGNHRFGYIYI